ncbi:MAG TPA: DUF4339 domain-containing protein [Pirellulales bacterium]|nr:DUF4339 domain-containing protein [Pirellulales bacterium]
MGIRFACGSCGHVMKVKDQFAGKRGICTNCQAKVDIPLQSTVEKLKRGGPDDSDLDKSASPDKPAMSNGTQTQAVAVAARHGGANVAVAAAPVAHSPGSPAPLAAPVVVPAARPDPIAEAPAMQWYVTPPGGTTPFGPATGDLFRSWIAEGRVSADSLVWRQDWSNWLRAGEVLPQFGPSMTAAAQSPIAMPVAAVPTAGLAPSFAAPSEVAQDTGMRSSADAAAFALRQARERRKSSTRMAILVLSIVVIVLLPLVYIVLTRH